MEQIQLIQITPKELAEQITKGVGEQLKEIRENLQPKEPTELMTRAEVADLLKIDLSTVWRYTKKKGYLKAYGIGKHVYYKRSEVEQALISLTPE